ncbi:MAG: MATE family efflux transporter [Deltaproteobacteria bacterium]|nr:MATE family efflux transporter [Deltaproteobacteria bacterium]MBW2398801.1 MATE family efflux transporter [Deltaproteobacteria bacterium]MBW2665440.1 MATE family efflux transporter [Deltaproteobacteria bacterium]
MSPSSEEPPSPHLSETEIEAVENADLSPALPSATLAAGATLPAGENVPHRRHGYGEIWQLSWPVMLAQVLANAVSLIDIAMVARLGPDAVAAVGYAAQFFFLSQSMLYAVGFACVALMARAIGAGQPERARQALAASIGVNVAAALTIMVVVLAKPAALLDLLGAEAQVAALTIPYLELMLLSSIPLAVSMTLESGLRADRNMRLPMQIAVVVTVAKTTLNFGLIFGAFGLPRLELVGAGLATVASQAIGLLCFLSVVVFARRDAPIALRPSDFLRARALLSEVVRISLPSIGERLAMNLALLAYFRILAEFGTSAIAAYTVGIRVLSFSWIPGVAFGTAAATLVGQALGAGDVGAARRAGWRTTRVAIIAAISLGAACALARLPLAEMFATDPETVAALGPFLLCLALCQPFLQSHFTLGGAHRGAGDTWTPFVASALGNWLVRVPLAAVFAFALALPLVWVWYAILFDHALRALWLARSFKRGGWSQSAVESA